MLNVSASIIIPPNIPSETPNRYLVPMPIGQLSRVLVSFPYGAGWLVGVSLWYENYPLIPIHRDTWLKGNDYTFDLHSTRNINREPFQIEIRGYNLDTVFQHEILFVFEINERIGLTDIEKQTLKFMSDFNEILIVTEGEMGEISSPLHVSTKVLTRPDYMTGNIVDKYFSVNVVGHGPTTRVTYTVPVGKRAFVDLLYLFGNNPAAGQSVSLSVQVTRNGNLNTLLRQDTDNNTNINSISKTNSPKIYLLEGDIIQISTSGTNVAQVVFQGGIQLWEFTPTQ